MRVHAHLNPLQPFSEGLYKIATSSSTSLLVTITAVAAGTLFLFNRSRPRNSPTKLAIAGSCCALVTTVSLLVIKAANQLSTLSYG